MRSKVEKEMDYGKLKFTIIVFIYKLVPGPAQFRPVRSTLFAGWAGGRLGPLPLHEPWKF